MVSKPAYKPAATMISPQSIIIDDAIGQSVRFFGSSLIQYLAHIIHRHVDAISLSGAFACYFLGSFLHAPLCLAGFTGAKFAGWFTGFARGKSSTSMGADPIKRIGDRKWSFRFVILGLLHE